MPSQEESEKRKADGRNYALKWTLIRGCLALSGPVPPRILSRSHTPIAFENRRDDGDSMRQLALSGCTVTTPTFCGFRVSAPEIVWGRCAITIGETSVIL